MNQECMDVFVHLYRFGICDKLYVLFVKLIKIQ